MISNIFIILTPFQKSVFFQLFKNEISSKKSLVIISDYITTNGFSQNVIKWKDYQLSFNELLKSPVFEFKNLFLKINDINLQIDNIFSDFRFSKTINIRVGTDKDIFTQLLINRVKKSKINFDLSLIDEGVGTYKSNTFKDKFQNLLFNLTSKIIFKTKIYYINQLGSHPDINTIYLRNPEMLGRKRKEVNYIKFDLKTQKLNEKCNSKKGVLIFSYPDQDGLLKYDEKVKFLKDLAFYLKVKDVELHIKPHPRETYQKMVTEMSNISNVIFLDNKIAGEEINYFDFDYVINFYSSIIIDLLKTEYPLDKIITIKLEANPNYDFKEKSLMVYDFKKLKIQNILNFE